MIDHAELCKALKYEPDTGLFRWIRPRNTRTKVGAVAGFLHPAGKRRKEMWQVGLDYKHYARSRLAWFYMTGRWPIFEIDHRDGDGLNDRWDNLREATRAQNEANKGHYKNNTIGLKGVYRMAGKYHASIWRGGRSYLGSFETAKAAHAAYCAAAKALDGQFFRL